MRWDSHFSQSVSQYVLVEAHTVCVSYHRSCKVLLKNRPRFALIASASLQTIFAKYIHWKWKCSKIPMNKAVKTAKNIDEELARSKCFLFELWKYHLTFRKRLNLIGCEKTRLRFKLPYFGVAYCELYFQYNCSSAWLKAKSSGSTLDIWTQWKVVDCENICSFQPRGQRPSILRPWWCGIPTLFSMFRHSICLQICVMGH